MQMLKGSIRLVLVDDHEVVRLGLHMLFKRTQTIEVVGEATTGQAAIDMAKRLTPDVVLLDLRLPDINGIDVCRDIREASPTTKVLILTTYADESAVLATIMANAQGYLLKEVIGDELIRAVEAVANGKSVLDPTITTQVLARIRQSGVGEAQASDEELSSQERRVMELLIEGKTNKEIAVALELSDKTVRNYLSNIFRKLGVERRSQAAVAFSRLSRHETSPL